MDQLEAIRTTAVALKHGSIKIIIDEPKQFVDLIVEKRERVPEAIDADGGLTKTKM
ncbi:MAG: hypothetical protein LBP76_09480 [Treponema sp.]|jgi:hypothetical protein|nr:hypothetical protein [Treponema sp.]